MTTTETPFAPVRDQEDPAHTAVPAYPQPTRTQDFAPSTEGAAVPPASASASASASAPAPTPGPLPNLNGGEGTSGARIQPIPTSSSNGFSSEGHAGQHPPSATGSAASANVTPAPVPQTAPQQHQQQHQHSGSYAAYMPASTPGARYGQMASFGQTAQPMPGPTPTAASGSAPAPAPAPAPGPAPASNYGPSTNGPSPTATSSAASRKVIPPSIVRPGPSPQGVEGWEERRIERELAAAQAAEEKANRKRWGSWKSNSGAASNAAPKSTGPAAAPAAVVPPASGGPTSNTGFGDAPQPAPTATPTATSTYASQPYAANTMSNVTNGASSYEKTPSYVPTEGGGGASGDASKTDMRHRRSNSGFKAALRTAGEKLALIAPKEPRSEEKLEASKQDAKTGPE
ncbi:unnamed protein product [Parajaminaea phylloscopi]